MKEELMVVWVLMEIMKRKKKIRVLYLGLELKEKKKELREGVFFCKREGVRWPWPAMVMGNGN